MVKPPVTDIYGTSAFEQLPRIDHEQPVGLEDVMPTILDIAGVSIPENIDGRSTLPFLAPSTERIREYLPIVCGQSFGMTDGRYSYSWFGDTGKELLFDHDNDPREMNDLADLATHQDIKTRLRQALVAHLSEHNSPSISNGELQVKPLKWPMEDARFSFRGMNRGRS